jgi:hypothetical protein
MSAKVREFKGRAGVYEVDVWFAWLDGTKFRRRYRAPTSTEKQAARWGEDLERRLFAQGRGGTLARSERDKAPTSPETANERKVPTLAEFWPRFIQEHCVANRQKPSGIERKESAYRTWLAPRLGTKRLDQIGAEEIVALKATLAKRSAKTANNVLTALSACLKFAGPEGLKRSEGLGIIERVPRIRLLAIDTDDVPEWYKVHEYRRL